MAPERVQGISGGCPADPLEVGAPGGDEVAHRVAAELLVRGARRAPRRPPPRRRPRAPRRRRRPSARRAPGPPRRLRGRPSRAASSVSAAASSRRGRRSPRRWRRPPRGRRRGWSSADGRCRSRRGPREPNLPASANPSPISTPLTAWIPITRGGEPRIEPVVLRGVAAEPGRDAAGADLDDPADGVALGAGRVDPLAQPGLVDASSRRPRSRSLPSSAFATAPAATCTAVWRAEARSSALRTSSRSYLSTPARSACPGRGQRHRLGALPLGLALGRPRVHPPAPVPVVAVGTTSASGVPSVLPCRSPASTSTRSCSICWRGERP